MYLTNEKRKYSLNDKYIYSNCKTFQGWGERNSQKEQDYNHLVPYEKNVEVANHEPSVK